MKYWQIIANYLRPVKVCAGSQLSIPKAEQSGSWMRLATTEVDGVSETRSGNLREITD
jgi:hypothetical protein